MDPDTDDFDGGFNLGGVAAPAAPVGQVTHLEVPYGVSRLIAHRAKDTVATSVKDRTPDNTVISWDIDIPLKAIATQPDGGQELVLSYNSGYLRSVVHSNPLLADNEKLKKRACQVLLGEIVVGQANDFGVTFDVAAPFLKAPGNFVSTAKPTYAPPSNKSVGASASGKAGAAPVAKKGPCIHHLVKSGESVKSRRDLTPQAIAFVDEYAGQTAEDQDRFIHPSPTLEGKSVIHVNLPRAAVADYYDDHPKIRGANLKLPRPTEEHAIAVCDTAIAQEALALCKAAIDTEIAYTNLVDKSGMSIVLSMPPRDRVNPVTRKVESVSGSVIDALRAAGRARLEARGAKNITPEMVDGLSVNLTGRVSVDSITVHPDFDYKS